MPLKLKSPLSLAELAKVISETWMAMPIVAYWLSMLISAALALTSLLPSMLPETSSTRVRLTFGGACGTRQRGVSSLAQGPSSRNTRRPPRSSDADAVSSSPSVTVPTRLIRPSAMDSESSASLPSGCFSASFWSSLRSPLAGSRDRLKASGPSGPPTRPSTRVALTLYRVIGSPAVVHRPLSALPPSARP
ncbi:hypothetical protein D3C76_1029890 [compost metagenome]